MSFTELIEAYQEKGIRGLNEACKKKKEKVEEEVDNETFTKELKDQIASMEGKKKQPPVAAAATQGVKSMDEDVEELDETPKVDQGLSGKQKVAARAARRDGWDTPILDVGNTTGGQWRGKKSPSPYKDSNVAKSGERKGMITKSAIAKTKEDIKARLRKEEVEIEELDERTLSQSESEKKEKYVKGMKKNLKGFKERYGERAKDVAYATATKMAKED